MKPADLTPAEVPAYYRPYIEKVPDLPLLEALAFSQQQVREVMTPLNEDQLAYRYEEDKWTIKEIVQHLMDAERVFNYRAMRFARADQTELPGFEQDDYILPSRANLRAIQDILAEFDAQRLSTLALFGSFSAEMLPRTGIASGVVVSVQAIGYITAGHDLHHIQIIQERYLQ